MVTLNLRRNVLKELLRREKERIYNEDGSLREGSFFVTGRDGRIYLGGDFEEAYRDIPFVREPLDFQVSSRVVEEELSELPLNCSIPQIGRDLKNFRELGIGDYSEIEERILARQKANLRGYDFALACRRFVPAPLVRALREDIAREETLARTEIRDDVKYPDEKNAPYIGDDGRSYDTPEALSQANEAHGRRTSQEIDKPDLGVLITK
jgi:hypothetical protein